MIRNALKIRGFTLSEVLITLGIIGVVAAFTIPVLMREYQEYQLKQAAKTAYSKAYQAIQQMKQDEGGTLKHFENNFRTFKPIFMTYFKVIKNCGWASCVTRDDDPESDTYSFSLYKTLAGNYAEGWRLDDGQFITSDGMFWGIENESGGYGVIMITVDVNGYLKLPNVYGKDVFMFQILRDNLVPMGIDGTIYPANLNHCSRSSSSPNSGFGCMYYVLKDINY